MEFAFAHKIPKVVYDLDTSGGLMEEVQRLIAPPYSDTIKKEKKSTISNFGYRKPKANNHEYCDSCYEGGDLICCDKCPVSFHLQCYDPPFSEDTAPKGFWVCRKCKSQMEILKNSLIPSKLNYINSSQRYNNHIKNMQISEPLISTNPTSSNLPNASNFNDNQVLKYQPNLLQHPFSKTHHISHKMNFPVYKDIYLNDLNLNNRKFNEAESEIDEIFFVASHSSYKQLIDKRESREKYHFGNQYVFEPVYKLSREVFMVNPTEFKLPKNITSPYNFPGSTKKKIISNPVANNIGNVLPNPSQTNLQNNLSTSQGQLDVNKSQLNILSNLLYTQLHNMNYQTKVSGLHNNYVWDKGAQHNNPMASALYKHKLQNTVVPHELDNNNLVPKPLKVCFVCNRSCQKQVLLQCDYCPLLFHLDCLDPPLTYPPNTQWMCPNHPEHILEDKLWKSNSLAERIKVWEILPTEDDNETASSFTVKAKFLHKVHRKYPPFRYKIKHPGRSKIKVPENVRIGYTTFRDKPCSQDTQINYTLIPATSTHFVISSLPTLTSSNTIPYEKPPDGETSKKALAHEQEEFISSLITLQSRIASDLCPSTSVIMDNNPSFDMFKGLPTPYNPPSINLPPMTTPHGWLDKGNLPPPPESPNLISRLIHRLQDHLSPSSTNCSNSQYHTGLSLPSYSSHTNFPFHHPNSFNNYSKSSSYKAGIPLDTTDLPLAVEQLVSSVTYNHVTHPKTSNNQHPIRRNSEHIDRLPTNTTNICSINTNDTKNSCATLKFSLSNLKLKNLGITKSGIAALNIPSSSSPSSSLLFKQHPPYRVGSTLPTNSGKLKAFLATSHQKSLASTSVFLNSTLTISKANLINASNTYKHEMSQCRDLKSKDKVTTTTSSADITKPVDSINQNIVLKDIGYEKRENFDVECIALLSESKVVGSFLTNNTFTPQGNNIVYYNHKFEKNQSITPTSSTLAHEPGEVIGPIIKTIESPTNEKVSFYPAIFSTSTYTDTTPLISLGTLNNDISSISSHTSDSTLCINGHEPPMSKLATFDDTTVSLNKHNKFRSEEISSPILHNGYYGDPFVKQLAELVHRKETTMPYSLLNGNQSPTEIPDTATMPPLLARKRFKSSCNENSYNTVLNGYTQHFEDDTDRLNGETESKIDCLTLDDDKSIPSGEGGLKTVFKNVRLPNGILYPQFRASKPFIMIPEYLTIGSNNDNDLNLNDYGKCDFISPKHACIFYDIETLEWELINHSLYGTTIVRKIDNEFILPNDTQLSDSNHNHGCQCLSSNHSKDPTLLVFSTAKLEKGDCIKFGCFQFKFTTKSADL